MHPELQSKLADWLSERTQERFHPHRVLRVRGGCIHKAYVLEGEGRSYFVKLNDASKQDAFEAEASGLEAISITKTLRAPRPIGYGEIAGHSFIAMERLCFGSASADGWARMGRQLAALHRCSSERYGWSRDNYIGESPQSNSPCDNWIEFFREQRLRPQFTMARRKGMQFEKAETFMDALSSLLEGHHPEPACLHGDLWSGNAGFLDDGSPVIFDPACYYGDRETDLAFSQFFGGFPATFYSAYEAAWPLPYGHEQRKDLYNLYHVLNHANIFGGGYARQAQTMIDQLT